MFQKASASAFYRRDAKDKAPLRDTTAELKTTAKQVGSPSSFPWSWQCIVAVAALVSVLSSLIFVQHSRSTRRILALKEDAKHVRPEDMMAELRSPRISENRIKTMHIFQNLEGTDSGELAPELAADLHEQCNPSLPKSQLSFVDPDAALEGQCGQAEAEQLRAALDALDYSYEAVTPVPYMHPPMMEQVFRVLSNANLSLAISHTSEYLDAKLKNAKLAALVKFFAWGWPVSSHHLRAALGSDAIGALQRCGLVTPCGNIPSQWISTLMVYPIPQTSAIVVTDWGKRHVVKPQALPVPTVGLDSLGLMHNAPGVQGKRVLDLSFGGGIQGIVAAQRGARSAEVLESSARAARVARFNCWLNGVHSQVKIGTLSEGKNLSGHFDVVLGRGQEEALEGILGAAGLLLGPEGVLAVATDIGEPDQLAETLCRDALPGFSGTIVYRKNSSEEVVEASRQGLLFGWRNSTQTKCDFSSMALPQPLDYKVGVTEDPEDRACYWSGLGCPLS